MKNKQKTKKSTEANKTKIKVMNAREARKIVKRNGWKLDRVNGSHYIYKHDGVDKILTISKNLNRMVWERCVEEYGINLNV